MDNLKEGDLVMYYCNFYNKDIIGIFVRKTPKRFVVKYLKDNQTNWRMQCGNEAGKIIDRYFHKKVSDIEYDKFMEIVNINSEHIEDNAKHCINPK